MLTCTYIYIPDLCVYLWRGGGRGCVRRLCMCIGWSRGWGGFRENDLVIKYSEGHFETRNIKKYIRLCLRWI